MILVAEGALDRITEHVPQPALVVMDENTEAVAGARVAAALEGETLVLPSDAHATRRWRSPCERACRAGSWRSARAR